MDRILSPRLLTVTCEPPWFVHIRSLSAWSRPGAVPRGSYPRALLTPDSCVFALLCLFLLVSSLFGTRRFATDVLSPLFYCSFINGCAGTTEPFWICRLHSPFLVSWCAHLPLLDSSASPLCGLRRSRAVRPSGAVRAFCSTGGSVVND